MKKIHIIFLIPIIVFLAIWLTSLAKCEVLTLVHGREFNTVYKQNTMMGDIDYLKVLDYTDTSARVYYVSAGRSAGDVLDFAKENGEWVYSDQWHTVWSATGSASEVIWPYWWHFIYGGF